LNKPERKREKNKRKNARAHKGKKPALGEKRLLPYIAYHKGTSTHGTKTHQNDKHKKQKGGGRTKPKSPCPLRKTREESMGKGKKKWRGEKLLCACTSHQKQHIRSCKENTPGEREVMQPKRGDSGIIG